MSPMAGGLPTGDDIIPLNANTTFAINTGAYGQPGGIYTLFAYTFEDPIGSPEPQTSYVNTGEFIFLRVYNNADPASANLYCDTTIMQTAELGQLGFLHWSTWFDGAGNWLETNPSTTTPIDWGDGVTGSVEGGVPSAPGSGQSGFPHPGGLANPENIGYYFTLTIDDNATVDVTICLDLTTLGYSPFNLAYYVNGGWIYEPATGSLSWSGDCVTFTLDPTVARGGNTKDGPSREDIGVPIVFSNEDGPLPYVLSNFSTAVFANEFVEISWATESEVGISLWNLYRQEPRSDEQTIIYTIPATNTTEPHEYIHNDTYVVNGETYYYYLESIEYDGTSEMYGPVSAIMLGEDIPDLPGQTELIGNHPNPFNPDTFIVFNVKADETAILSIYNTKGQLVMKRTFEPGFHNYSWQADSNPSGVYFYKLETESHTSVKKMLLLK